MWNDTRYRLRAQVSESDGFLRLLMKPRNGRSWTAEERASIRRRLRSKRLPGFWRFALAVGGGVALGTLAWLIDRRRLRAKARAGGRRDNDRPVGVIG
jgi:hypothetical protein